MATDGSVWQTATPLSTPTSVPGGLDLIEYANGDARRTVWGGGTGCAHGRRTLLRGLGLDDSQPGLLGKVRIKD